MSPKYAICFSASHLLKKHISPLSSSSLPSSPVPPSTKTTLESALFVSTIFCANSFEQFLLYFTSNRDFGSVEQYPKHPSYLSTIPERVILEVSLLHFQNICDILVTFDMLKLLKSTCSRLLQ